MSGADSNRRVLYLIHAADDYALAALLKFEIERQIEGWTVFVASKAGQIPTGHDWLEEVHNNLSAATSFLLLLTPQSVERSWVWYEAGVAWHSGKRRLPVAAAGLPRESIDFPLKTIQTLALEAPEDASQLFNDLGGQLESPEGFCAKVRTLSVSLPLAVSKERRERVEEALGRLDAPPKLLLRRMLPGGLTLDEMKTALEEPPHYVSDTVSIEKMLNALREHDLIQGDSLGRWRVKSDVEPIVSRRLEPSRFALQLLQLAAEIRVWVQGQNGAIDGNFFHQRFGGRLKVLREKAERDHGETDSWLDKNPSADTAVRQIADALERVAGNVP